VPGWKREADALFVRVGFSVDDLLAWRVTRCVDADPSAGVEVAYELIDAIRSSGAFDGVHLIPVGRYVEMASRLERGGG